MMQRNALRGFSVFTRLQEMAAKWSSKGQSPRRHVEQLEDRRLLSAITLNDGIIEVQGNSSGSNKLYVDLINNGKNAYVIANNLFKTIPVGSFSAIRITGGSGFDKVYVNTKITKPADIKTFAGNDNINCGGGSDDVQAGDGDDVIYARVGNDKIDAGNGNDKVWGNEGDDTINGGGGNDTIAGEVGNDTLIGGDGNDFLTAASGNDTLDGGNGTDTLIAGLGDDVLRGGADNDILKPESGHDNVDGGTGTNDQLIGLTGDDTVAGGGSGTPTGVGSTPPPAPQPGPTDSGGSSSGDLQDSQGPRPVIHASSRTGVSSLAVFVHGLESDVKVGTPLTARYQWDFGDSNGSHNTLDGWNAAHVYDRPGDYSLKLTITNEDGRSNTVSTTIKVSEDNRRTIYIDPNGNDGNPGTSPDSAVQSPRRALQLMTDDSRILFKRGGRWDINFSMSINHSRVLIGAYGDGARPVLNRVKGIGESLIGLYGESDHVVIQDLTFDSPYAAVGNKAPKIKADGIYPRGTNNTIRNCEFLDLDDAINNNGNPVGLLVENNSAPLATGIRGYFVWGQGSDHVYIGNTVANSTREHNIRTSGLDRALIADNNLTNMNRSKIDGPDFNKGTIEIHKGSYAYVANNDLHTGDLRAGPRGGGVEPASTATDWTVFENNRVSDVDIQIFPGTHHLMMRNNIVMRNTANAINIRPTDGQRRDVADIQIVNNTAITNSDRGQFIKTGAGSGNGAVTLRNNLWLSPNFIAGTNGSAPVYVEGSNAGLFGRVDHNVWPDPVSWAAFGQGGIMYVWPKWSNAKGYYSPREWDALSQVSDEHYNRTDTDDRLAPRSGSTAATAAVKTPGVFTDIYGKPRPANGDWSAGAVQI